MPSRAYHPPEDIGSTFWPALGPYSSLDPAVLREHMRQLQRASVGVIAVSWYPPHKNDGQIPSSSSSYSDALMPLILQHAAEAGISVCLHMEPYDGRTAQSLRQDIAHALDRYGQHPALLRVGGRPLLYAYDSYQVPAHEWAALLKPRGKHSIRGTAHDAAVLGLVLGQETRQHVLQAGFDGVYTYFASARFTSAASPAAWEETVRWAKGHGLVTSISVGPGYNDESIRPWNAENSHDRRQGDYYATMFRAAINAKPEFISITSFNEWHEGTQIEAAIPRSQKDGSVYPYLDYGAHDPDFYLSLTSEFAKLFK